MLLYKSRHTFKEHTMINTIIHDPASARIALWTLVLALIGTERRQARSHAIMTFITNEYGY